MSDFKVTTGMAIPILDSSDWNIHEQLRKVSEEHHEVIAESKYISENYYTLAGELWDLIQSSFTALQILEREYGDKYFIESTNNRHCTKLRDRNDDGKIKIKCAYELKEV